MTTVPGAPDGDGGRGVGVGVGEGREARGAGAAARELDVVVLGATGVTGRLVARHLAQRAASTGARWGVAGRSRDRLEQVRRDVAVAPDDGTVVVADLQDAASLAAMARRAAVVLNLAGPYSQTAEDVIGACVDAGTSYVDLSGEIPAVARTVRRWHDAARAAGVCVVQVCGFEALPTDLSVLLATEAARATGTGAVVAVEAVVAVTPPAIRLRPSDAVSGGTLQSLAAALADRDAASLADPAALVGGPRAQSVRSRSPLRFGPRVRDGRVLGPAVPAAFIDPPVVHRTAALLGEEPFAFRESFDLGPRRSPGGSARLLVAALLSGGQALLASLARLPGPVRRLLTAGLGRVLPGSGSGPRGEVLEDWHWSVRVEAVTAQDARAQTVLSASGHPGYAATARMLGEVGLLLAQGGAASGRAGCLTPALALGLHGAERLAAAHVQVATDVSTG